jgi:ethanolamine ammonia-lyase small subunit
MDNQMEKMIIDKVLKELLKGGGMQNSESIIEPKDCMPVELESKEKIQIQNPHNMEALKIMRNSTPARIAVGRCGARQKTSTLLNFLADHAAAQDAVFVDVSDEFIEKNNLFKTVTVVKDKDEYLKRPELGKLLSEESKKMILSKCESGKQVQIIIVDGLSSTAIEANVADVLPALIQGLKSEGISVGTPFFVKYGRVRVEDEIGMLLNCDVVVELVGERPGLVTAESMSSYMIYRPSSSTVEADRTVISNIHKGGTPPTEAGAHMATVVKRILDNKASGIKLSQLLK